MFSKGNQRKRKWESFGKTQHPQSKLVKEDNDSFPYKTMVNLFASRSRFREIIRTKAKISKYHILENGNTGQDICRAIINTDIGHTESYRNANFNGIIPVLSPILEIFRSRHNRYDYSKELKYVIAKHGKKNAKQKYKNQIHIHTLQYFFSLLIYENIPVKLFGTLKNVKMIKKTIYRLLKTVPSKILITKAFKRTISKTNAIGASLSLQPLLKKLDISKIEWLHPIISNERCIIVLKLLHWFFAQYIIKTLHKYLVMKMVKKQWIYIAKDDWCKMQEEYIREKESRGDFVAFTALDESKWNLPIGTYKFIPSTSGLRALLIMKYKAKERFDDIDVVLRFLQQLYITYFNEEGIPTVARCRKETLKYKRSTSKPLYYVRCDIQDAFGSVIQEKLDDIISTCCRQQLPRYLVVRTYNLTRSRKSLRKKVCNSQTVQFVNLKSQIHKNATVANEKPRLIRKTYLASKIRKLIFNQKVRVNGKIYLIKSGVPQGITVSSILADIYYHHMFKEKFSVYKNNGFLCTYVDDILYITEDAHYAEEFLETVRNGIPEYNVKFNPDKIETNVNIPYKPKKVTFLGWNVTL